jgi:hypothetical protein
VSEVFAGALPHRREYRLLGKSCGKHKRRFQAQLLAALNIGIDDKTVQAWKPAIEKEAAFA